MRRPRSSRRFHRLPGRPFDLRNDRPAADQNVSSLWKGPVKRSPNQLIDLLPVLSDSRPVSVIMRGKKQGKSNKRSNKGRGKSSQVSETDIQVILADAEAALEQVDLDTAKARYILALQIEPNNTKVMDSLAELLLQMGEIGDAYMVLKRSIELCPGENGVKYLYFAQLHQGEEAIKLYNLAIQLLHSSFQSAEVRGPLSIITVP
jgi:tetratricopeptide (TPR) repeat protein